MMDTDMNCGGCAKDEAECECESPKYYQCGWCGTLVDMCGNIIPDAEAEKMEVDWDKAQAIQGIGCCNDWEQDPECTREMLMDAGR